MFEAKPDDSVVIRLQMSWTVVACLMVAASYVPLALIFGGWWQLLLVVLGAISFIISQDLSRRADARHDHYFVIGVILAVSGLYCLMRF